MFHKRFAIEYRAIGTTRSSVGPGDGAWRMWPNSPDYQRWVLTIGRDNALLMLRIAHFTTHEFRPFEEQRPVPVAFKGYQAPVRIHQRSKPGQAPAVHI